MKKQTLICLSGWAVSVALGSALVYVTRKKKKALGVINIFYEGANPTPTMSLSFNSNRDVAKMMGKKTVIFDVKIVRIEEPSSDDK